MTSILGRMATYSGQVIEWDKAINSGIDLQPKVYDWNAAPPVVPNEMVLCHCDTGCYQIFFCLVKFRFPTS